MICPNCADRLSVMLRDDQPILHCKTCGCTFFEENGINRIGISTAQELAETKESISISGEPKQCPKDESVLKPLYEESIPDNVILLQCPTCKGILAFPEDLVNFKNAQNVKIQYFKLWNKPLPSLKSVLVLSLLLLLSVTMFSTFVKSPGTTNIRAEDEITNIHFSVSNRLLLISFKTKRPVISRINLYDRTKRSNQSKLISPVPATIHFTTVSTLNLQDKIEYEITITANDGKSVSTGMQKLSLEQK